jgi:hypothetical protein
MKAVFGVAAVTAVALAATTGLQAERQLDALQPECEVTVGLETVPVQADPVTVPVKHTAAVGDSVAAVLPEESKITVLSVNREEDDEPLTLRLVVNTSEATPGEWALTIRGTEAECVGKVTVAPAPEADGR